MFPGERLHGRRSGPMFSSGRASRASPGSVDRTGRCRRTLGAVLMTAGLAAAVCAADRHPALSPEEALRSFQLEPGLRIELVAAEPLVVDPVALTFDERGRLFVVEGRGYPDPVEGGGRTTLGRVALLEDADGDGRYDRRKEFATGLGYVNGIALWRGGVFVTAAPDVLYLKDTDDDGVADERRVVLTGFDATKTAQLRVSHPTLGLDGRIYVTSGINGGRVTSPLHPERPPVVFSLRDGRYNPDTLEFESTGGRGQYGLAFDPFGRRFICSNRHPVLQVMLEPWQLRNPHLAFSETTQEVSKVEAEARVFPISRATLSADFVPSLMATPHTGTFTSACGLVVFGGTGLTPEHGGNVFICEPAQNLVQRQVLRPEGTSFRADPAQKGREFLASTDVWFRPVYLSSGPDGALYVADMYRREIDHPRYVPAESRGGLDFEGGKDRGRIYRIVREDLSAAERRARMARAARPEEASELVAELVSDDEWWRARAHRRLIERGARDLAPQLERVAATAGLAAARARTLWVLHGLGAVSSPVLAAMLRDADAGVREQAVTLAGLALPRSPELLQPLLARSEDPDARVRLATALALGPVEDPAAVPALARIAARDGQDRWARAAVLSAIGTRMESFRAALHALPSEHRGALAVVTEHLGRVFGAGASPEDCREYLRPLLEEEGDFAGRIPAVLGLLDGFGARPEGRAERGHDVVERVLGSFARDGGVVIERFFAAAAERASDDRASKAERLNAIALLGYADYERAAPVLGRLLDARQPPEVQLQAVRAIERTGDPRGAAQLVARENWERYTPRIREAVLATLGSKPAFIAVLFDAIKQGTPAVAEISLTRRTQLLKHADAGVRARAEEMFRSLEAGDRMQVYRDHRESLKATGDVRRGREVFQRACAACHTHQGTGGNVGPDLTGIRNQPADAILLHILVPNYEVAPAYQTLTVATRDGRTLTGWLAGETETSVTLRTAFATEETVLRSSIGALTASGLSLMPDGLEQAMSKEELGALIAFLKHGE